MYAIETVGLTKDFAIGFWRRRAKRALDGLNLQVQAGQVFGLLGPNGAGKSTTLKLLMRLIFPTSGTARLYGASLDDFRAHARVGFLPENPYFYDHLTPEEFLNFAGSLFGLSAGERRERTSRLLARVGLLESRDVPLRKFSKGMVQRAGIAQALINNPDLVILDEPMSGLDPLGRREVRDLILELREEGKTILFSTHILSDAETLCDQVAILNQGRLLGSGELREILSVGVAATEMVIEGPSAQLLEELRGRARSVIRTGERVRVSVEGESGVPAVIQTVLRSGARIVSINPVKMSLEDYFMARLSGAAGAPASVSGAGPAEGGERS
jgi:ABC-2 type transport system ATP-binding protein